ncbi:hypothetical protein DPEC_G00263830 [Dallia pectoralis]|uniref:Uncharacterized protein n=1 Tax=Dallia pectoralis TaxID=75939 RepID=A0ACC2FS51_DALPE|nr:hypothetical protein DPEC_G00263830 [Dallia pectoralis]
MNSRPDRKPWALEIDSALPPINHAYTFTAYRLLPPLLLPRKRADGGGDRAPRDIWSSTCITIGRTERDPMQLESDMCMRLIPGANQTKPSFVQAFIIVQTPAAVGHYRPLSAPSQQTHSSLHPTASLDRNQWTLETIGIWHRRSYLHL